MIETLLSPLVESATVDLSGADGLVFRKKILDVQTIHYPTGDGKRVKINFDRAYHNELIKSFRAGVMDAPTVQLATADNAHNMDPRLTYGHVIDLSPEQAGDADGPGLYATVRALTPKHAKLFRDNPQIGVSAQILSGRERVDGAKFGRFVRHVLATLDPRVTKLGEWRAVSLSNDDGELIDLTTADTEELDMGAETDTGDVLELSDEDIEDALAEAAAAMDDDEGADDTSDDDTDEDSGDEPTSEEKDTSMSNRTDPAVTSLASRVDAAEQTNTVLLDRLAASDWKTQRLTYSQQGVPKHMLDLAEPAMAAADDAELTTVSLAHEDGQTKITRGKGDAKAIIRSMLDACKGLVNLSENPAGLTTDPGDEQGDKQQNEIKSALDAWDKRSGH